MTLAVTRAQQGDPHAAERCALEALSLITHTPYTRLEILARGCLGSIYHNQDDLEQARTHFQVVATLATRTGDTEALAEALGCLGNIAHDRLNFDRAGTLYRSALAHCDALDHAPLRAIFTGYLGCLSLDLGHLEDALEQLTAACTASSHAGLQRFEGLWNAILGATLAIMEHALPARAAFDRATILLEPLADPVLLWCLSTHRGHLDRLHRPHDRESVMSRLSRPLDRDTDDARFARRILERAIQSSDIWTFDAQGAFFTTPQGTTHDLRKRGPLRRILAALVGHLRDNPGQPLNAAAIRGAGWPGEHLIEDAASGRVRDAVWQLRKLGLRPVLHTVDEGYLLDPDIQFEI